MALLFVDSFDHYPSADRLLKWTANWSNGVTISAGNGRFGTAALRAAPQTGGQGIRKTFPSTYAGGVIGFAYKPSAITAGLGVCLVLDGTSEQVSFILNSSGQIEARRGGTGGTLITNGSIQLSANVWHYLEFKVNINSSGGTLDLKINGTADLTYTGDTNNTANNYFNGIAFFNNSSTLDAYWDDVYVLSSVGSPNDYLGDSRVECLFPNGNGNSSMFDGSDGNQVDNYLLVDEADSDEDTTYVESADVNDKDTYAYGDLATTSGTVHAVCPIPYHRKTASGSKTLVTVARTGGGTEEDSAAKVVLDSYTYGPDYRTTKPGGGAWTVSDVNAAEFGIKVAS